jgi:hypothetical protein
MNINAIVKGVTVGAAVGTGWYVFSKASDRKKHSMKRHAGKALKAAGCVLEDITSLVM